MFADGSIREGKLDAKGHAHLENIPQGEVKVYFGEDPRPYQPQPVKNAGKTTLEKVQQELAQFGHSVSADNIDSLLEAMAGRNIQ